MHQCRLQLNFHKIHKLSRFCHSDPHLWWHKAQGVMYRLPIIVSTIQLESPGETSWRKLTPAVQWFTQGGYQSVIFVPSTPGSVLQLRHQEEINWHCIKICVVEKAGRSVKSLLKLTDPFQSLTCGWVLRFICKTQKKGLCDKNGVNYIITCMGCESVGQKREYNGETSKNAYKRGKQHQDENKNSPRIL